MSMLYFAWGSTIMKERDEPMSIQEIRNHACESLMYHLDLPKLDKGQIDIAVDPFRIGIIAAQLDDGSQYVIFRNGDVRDSSFSSWPPQLTIIPKGD